MRDPLAHPESLIRSVYAYVVYRIGPGPDADDVTSETFARALRYRDSYDPNRGEPLAWLIGIARRCIAARGEPDDVGDSLVEAVSSDLEERAAQRIDLAGALATLSARDRELLALRYGADLTARQIGELLELRTNAVEVALHRALASLRRTLGEDAAAPRHPVALESA